MRKYYPLAFPVVAMLVVLFAAYRRDVWIPHVVRTYMAILILIGVPAGLLMWLIIHPFANSLRRVGLVRAYVIVAIPIALLVATMVWLRDAILAIDFGTNYFLMALSVIPFALAMVIYLNHRKYLTLQIQMGVPELIGSREGVLLTEGIYSRVRHPRYVETILWILGYAFFTNYLAMYLAFLLMLPIMHAIVLLEEKELKKRFGSAYEEYCRHVPRYIPRVTWESQKAA